MLVDRMAYPGRHSFDRAATSGIPPAGQRRAMLPELPRLEPRAVDLPMTGALRFLLACLALAMTGCATAPPLSTEPEVQLVFPPPPAVPRYIYERSLYGSKDLDERAKKSALMTLLDGKNDTQEQNGEGMARPQALAVLHGRVFIANALDSPISVFDIPDKRFFKIGENKTWSLADAARIECRPSRQSLCCGRQGKCHFCIR